jgi:hypothetical protein
MAGLGGVGAAMPGVPAPPLVGGVAGAPGNPILPPAPLPAYFVPSPAHGEISRMVTSLHGGDLGRFLALMNTEMANMNHMLADPTGSGLLAHALGVQTGPCAFLAVVPAAAAGQVRIEVIHCTRQYIIPATQPNSATDPLQGRMILFMREVSNNQLPIVLMKPPTGLHAYFASQQTAVPDEVLLDAFYTRLAPVPHCGCKFS